MISWPFDSFVSDDGEGNLTYDRAFNSANLRKIFKGLYTNGAAMSDKSDALKVTNALGMELTVKAGMAVIEGAMGYLEDDATIELDAAHSTYDRIDTIVARLNTNIAGRAVTIEYIKGVAAPSPSAPSIVRAGGVYDLRLANVSVAAGVTSITASRITDTRLGAECGVATARPQVVDTTDIFTQYQAALTEYMQYVQECLDETTAGNMQSQITSLSTAVNSLNTALASMNSMLTELASARDIKDGFSFSNAYWHVDDVHCVGKIVILKGSLERQWNGTGVVRRSEEGNTAAVYLTVPAGYQPITPAEVLFGGWIITSSNNLDAQAHFRLESNVKDTNQNGSTRHLIYGYAYRLAALHNFQIIYVRSGSVS